MTTGPGYTDPNPGGYEAPDGVEATIPGQPDDAGSRDPSNECTWEHEWKVGDRVIVYPLLDERIGYLVIPTGDE
jgi:hypothetical protein